MSVARPRIGWRVGVGGLFLVVTAACVAVSIFPAADAAALWQRVWPVLLFAAAMTVVAECASELGLFSMAAAFVARVGRGRVWPVWLLLVALTLVCTVFFSLDTTAVLVTSIAVGLARGFGRAVTAVFALTVVWLANTGSLLLPISNLTNLLAAQHSVTSGPMEFASQSWGVALVGMLVPTAVLAVLLAWALRRGGVTASGDDDVLLASPPLSSDHPFQLRQLMAAAVLVLLLGALLTGLPVWAPACVAALALVTIVGRGSFAHPRLVPWRTLVLTLGLFGVTGAVSVSAFGVWMSGVAAEFIAASAAPQLATAALGAGAANLLNNLPAYLMLEPAAAHSGTLLALLVGVNAGPLILPWGSLATLLWHERLAAEGMRVPWGRFAALGVLVVTLTLGVSALVLSN